MTRDRILQEATDLYSRYGIKNVSMDHLARELQISKKTLYEEFGNKDGLVSECIEYVLLRIGSFAEKMQSESICALEKIVRISAGISGYISSVCPAFYKDLKKYMEAERILERHKVDLWEKSGELFKEGIREGDIIESADLHLIAVILIDQSHNVNQSYNTQITTALLRGLCTPQGVKKLESYYAREKDRSRKNPISENNE